MPDLSETCPSCAREMEIIITAHVMERLQDRAFNYFFKDSNPAQGKRAWLVNKAVAAIKYGTPLKTDIPAQAKIWHNGWIFVFGRDGNKSVLITLINKNCPPKSDWLNERKLAL